MKLVARAALFARFDGGRDRYGDRGGAASSEASLALGLQSRDRNRVGDGVGGGDGDRNRVGDGDGDRNRVGDGHRGRGGVGYDAKVCLDGHELLERARRPARRFMLLPWSMPRTDVLLARARSIDEERARSLERELGRQRAVAVLLSTAFAPLHPSAGWQVDALDEIAKSGWRSRRQKSDLARRILARVGDLSDSDKALRELRRAVWAEKARIALRELLPSSAGGAGIEVTAGEISHLAEMAWEVALAEATRYVASRFGEPRLDGSGRSGFVVLGMGKLGGAELNAGSDVDVMFVYDSDEGRAGELSLHDFWTRVARRAVSIIETPSGDGLIWRVDLRLRPEGSQGPVVNSVSAAERYYETWGRLWERAALLRARPVAGDLVLGRELERRVIAPFVFRREVDPSIATALSELVVRSRAELSAAPERDLKLGPGGIREAEFFVQALQLIWGGREPSLRVTGTLEALARLRSRGLVSDREGRTIASAYRLLRRVEHRVQWMTGVQTHLLPEAPAELEHLARTLEHPSAASLLEELDAARSRVSHLFGSLAPEAPRPPPRYAALFGETEELEPGESLDKTLGAEVAEHVRALARRRDGLFGAATRERHPDLADEVLDAILGSPDPEQAVRMLRALLARFSDPAPFVTLLAEDRRALNQLVWIFGASVFVAEAVVSRPELTELLLFGGGAVPDVRGEIARELTSAAERTSEGEEPYERRDRLLSALRRAKRRVMVEVALADLSGMITMRQATRLLSDLADETLDRSVRFELGDAAEGLCLLAVGKLGGREIGYGSDLDVLFVYDPERAPAGRDPAEYFARVAQRIIRLISEPHPAGPGYELDTRLRPSGSHGMLVTSLGSFARYHGVASCEREAAGPGVQSSGAAWERQALIRARACAGDAALAEQTMAVCNRAAYEAGAPPVEEMHRLRMRMELELGRERAGRFDLRTGRGGLLDVEFATQWLQMRHGRDPRVRTADTALALDALVTAGYLPRAEYETFRDAYAFLRRLEQRIHVLHATSATVIDARSPGLAQLARRMGMHDSARRSALEELLDQYQEVTTAVRAAYERVLGIRDLGGTSSAAASPPRSHRR
jgi:glutamate-ammonia-ligase adenylyltransferase